MGQERGALTSVTKTWLTSRDTLSDPQGILAGVPFFDEIMAYAGCS